MIKSFSNIEKLAASGVMDTVGDYGGGAVGWLTEKADAMGDAAGKGAAELRRTKTRTLDQTRAANDRELGGQLMLPYMSPEMRDSFYSNLRKGGVRGLWHGGPAGRMNAARAEASNAALDAMPYATEYGAMGGLGGAGLGLLLSLLGRGGLSGAVLGTLGGGALGTALGSGAGWLMRDEVKKGLQKRLEQTLSPAHPVETAKTIWHSIF